MKYIVFTSAFLGGFLLYLLSNASANTAASGEYYTLLVVLNGLLVLILVVLIAIQLFKLYQNIRQRVMGSRFTLRLLGSFALMAVIPGLIVYLVSVNFLTRSIESWFNVKVESALEGGLNLGQTALEIMLADVKEKGEGMATSLALLPANAHFATLNELRERNAVQEATLLTPQGRILAVSSGDASSFLPDLPSIAQLRQARQRLYGNIEPIDGKGLFLRVLVPVNVQDLVGETRILQLMQPVPKALATTAESVQDVYQDYQQLSYSRTALREVFALTLTLVMMLSMLTAVAIAFVLSRRLSAPLRVLAEGTKAIASGDYSTMLPAHGKDELGVLVQSFNSMTQQLGDATRAAGRNRARVEAARGYLETILAHLSSGVLALNERGELRTFNQATVSILGVSLESYVGFTPDKIIEKQPHLANFFHVIASHCKPDDASPQKDDVQTQVELVASQGQKIITVRGTKLPDGGYVAVFDDATAMVQAQRDAAWGEVARRLAHEIKNPLTPIQLSAERIAHRLSDKLESADAEVLQRSTQTIVNQVDALKQMVNEFSEYARSPSLHLNKLDINALIKEILSLYDMPKVKIDLQLAHEKILIKGDSNMLRQVLHNLLQNAQDALIDQSSPIIMVHTGVWQNNMILTVQDNGSGLPAEMVTRVFEPYMTTKPHGTGLGLAIVKKIVEEHRGSIKIENIAQSELGGSGVVVTITIPLFNE
ncbi:MAG: PAS domain-containing sensor histidine kinase [Betaproteobacteria bacterium HGW-Betaproteobacteria-22]|nr:MAG: PAS domain-containing sensor histidine kinase [Betaproteobacteria bacterium HGW-Betaproteobacteria-22]